MSALLQAPDSIDIDPKRESRREREFYEYYDALVHLSDGVAPVYCDVADDEAVKRHVPVQSPDKTLSAFCQLGALQLRAKRALIFFFNTTHAFILAEATPTLSLQDRSRHKDELWMGFSMIDRSHSVCEYTIQLPSIRPEGPYASTEIPLNIVPDLRATRQFCNYPYVAGGPEIKFYAGVPITTANGINIGAFCILDDEVRPGLSKTEETFLREMSVTVTQHLEGIRAKADRERGAKMVEALNTFIQGSSDSRTQKHRGNMRGRPVRKTRSPLIEQHAANSADEEDSGVKIASQRHSGRSDQSSSGVQPLLTVAHAEMVRNRSLSGDDMQREKPIASSHDPASDAKHHQGRPETGLVSDGTHVLDLPSSLMSTLSRASELLRKAIDVDEVVFLDASTIKVPPSSFGGLAKDRGKGFEPSTVSGTNGTDSEEQESEQQTCCRIVSQSHVSSGVSPSTAHTTTSGASEGFLKTLLRRYPNGNIWNFYTNDETTSSDDSFEQTRIYGMARTEAESGPNNNGTEATATPSRRTGAHSRRREAATLQRLFPEARSLALYGLEDHARKRWHAACVLWTSSRTRLFANVAELNFIAAFCDVVTAEIHRREVENSDKAKADFISSISHELRSPLHGILGSAEVLHEQDLDVFSQSMVHQISICGKTLADFVEHILDVSNINHSAKHKRKDVLKGLRVPTSRPVQSDLRGSMSQHNILLDEVTEEIVESTVTSYLYNRKSNSGRPVTTILDVEQLGSEQWHCKLDAGGWKRICVNLITNSLKCTSKGHVHVSLKTDISGPNRRCNAVLSVQDTGKGMSKEFVENELFAAFSQEDSFLEGTGLGMHIVARIVKSFGGKIEVTTDQTGGGTRVTVVVPLKSNLLDRQVDSSLSMSEGFGGLTAGIVHSEVTDPTIADYQARELQLTILAKSCNQMGLTTTVIDREIQPNATYTHLNIITEEDLINCFQRWDVGMDSDLKIAVNAKPLIVLCHRVYSEKEMRAYVDRILSNQSIGYITQPCAPRRLRGTILSVLERQRSVRAIASVQDDTRANQGAEDSRTNTSRPRIPIRPHTTGESGVQKDHGSSLADASPSFDHSGHSSAPLEDSGFSLMVVEDNPINLQLLVTYARKQGLRCVTAENGKEAFEAYKLAHETQQRNSSHAIPGVLIMDINMPVWSGFESTRAIRSYERKHDLVAAKIIALTGLGSMEAKREAFSSGCDLFLSKPLRFKELTKILGSFKADAG